MRAPEVIGLIASGSIKPEAEIIALELGYPPIKVTLKLKAGDVQKLMLDTRTVSDVLRRCFGQRRILRERFSDETRDPCIRSAEEIINDVVFRTSFRVLVRMPLSSNS